MVSSLLFYRKGLMTRRYYAPPFPNRSILIVPAFHEFPRYCDQTYLKIVLLKEVHPYPYLLPLVTNKDEVFSKMFFP